MIILDQDKVGLINSDMMIGFSTRANENGVDYVVVAVPTLEHNIVIGAYETEGRAQQVLDNLFTEFKAGCRAFEMPKE